MTSTHESIPGYTFGSPTVPESQVSMAEFEGLCVTAGFTEEDKRLLKVAGDVLAKSATEIVQLWRSHIIASIPNLARHSRTPEGSPLPRYLQRSNRRFEQWILDTCLRPYDQDWLNYQQEIALRHMTAKKNRTDDVDSTPYVPFRDIIAFIAVMNETVKPFLAEPGNPPDLVDRMHRAWCKSMQIQIAIWARAYTDASRTVNQW